MTHDSTNIVEDECNDILKVRGNNLNFGDSHHDVYLGNDKIFYNLKVPDDSNLSFISPESIKLEDAIKGNWAIESISWPIAKW